MKLFSELIRNGHAWSLQGSYGRTAKALIEAGWLDQEGNILKELNDAEATSENVKEEQDRDYTASQKSEIKKIAAFEKGDTAEQTVDKDYELKVKGLSDYNLAEMLADYEANEKGLATLSFNEYKEDALKSVKSSRDAAEKKLLKFIGTPAVLDWKKAFKEMEDSEVKFAGEKDLYVEWKEGKMAWEKKEKFTATSEEEKLKQMDGVGGEEEKGQVGKEAGLHCERCGGSLATETAYCVDCIKAMAAGKTASKKTAATPVEIIEKKVDKLIKDTIDKKFEELTMPAADPMVAPLVSEDSTEDKTLDALDVPHVEPVDAKPAADLKEGDDVEIEKVKDDKEASLKKADEMPIPMADKQPMGEQAPSDATKHTYKVTFENGDHLVTGFNGDLATAKAYYVGQGFEFDETQPMVKAVSVEELVWRSETSINKESR